METGRLCSFREIFTNEIRYRNTPFTARQIERVAKRFMGDNDDILKEKAVHDFKTTNSVVPDHVHIDTDVLSNARWYILHALWRFARLHDESSTQCDLDLGLMLSLWRLGPGASNDVTGTHFTQKIQQPFSATLPCQPLLRLMRRLNLHLCRYDTDHGCKFVTSGGSRLGTVPKNEDTHRTICIEPSGNMALQLAAGAYLEGALRCTGTDIRTQADKNKILARLGSLDGSLATIDLKSASDMISIDLVRQLLPKVWFELLMIIRSEFCTLPDGSVEKLNMISTMGNGFTFPLMTLIIKSLIYGMQCQYPSSRNLWLDPQVTGVFGDDIIVPSHWYHDLVKVLVSAGLVVNENKSYVDGPFRESCGGDYHYGVDITPIYVKSLRSDPEIYVAINQVIKVASKHRICVIETLEYLVSLLHKGPFFVPQWEDPSSGILSRDVDRRYNIYLPVQQYKRVEKHPLNLLAVLGGYVNSNQKGELLYLPRSRATRYQVKKRRLPKGFLHGRYSNYMNDEENSYAEFLIGTLM